ncbi:uncharacterized protein LOC131953614 [Physella acuta]|uniref:uncharacterized protein LOC131953614 n=1 Tax=Physella acuta TaxID=109671 RepID=UPI0027DEA6D1|nr:uncharacterized protein LOC131953614 [Physella acuta]
MSSYQELVEQTETDKMTKEAKQEIMKNVGHTSVLVMQSETLKPNAEETCQGHKRPIKSERRRKQRVKEHVEVVWTPVGSKVVVVGEGRTPTHMLDSRTPTHMLDSRTPTHILEDRTPTHVLEEGTSAKLLGKETAECPLTLNMSDGVLIRNDKDQNLVNKTSCYHDNCMPEWPGHSRNKADPYLTGVCHVGSKDETNQSAEYRNFVNTMSSRGHKTHSGVESENIIYENVGDIKTCPAQTSMAGCLSLVCGLEVTGINTATQDVTTLSTDSKLSSQDVPTLSRSSKIIGQDVPSISEDSKLSNQAVPTLSTDSKLSCQDVPTLSTDSKLSNQAVPTLSTDSKLSNQAVPTLSTDSNISCQDVPTKSRDSKLLNQAVQTLSTDSKLSCQEITTKSRDSQMCGQQTSPTRSRRPRVVKENVIIINSSQGPKIIVEDSRAQSIHENKSPCLEIDYINKDLCIENDYINKDLCLENDYINKDLCSENDYINKDLCLDTVQSTVSHGAWPETDQFTKGPCLCSGHLNQDLCSCTGQRKNCLYFNETISHQTNENDFCEFIVYF